MERSSSGLPRPGARSALTHPAAVRWYNGAAGGLLVQPGTGILDSSPFRSASFMPPQTPEAAQQLRQVLRALHRQFNGGGGNCAQVACVLDCVLDTGGDFVVVSGEHYVFADHVFVRWQDRLWDISGAHTPEQAQAQWCSEPDDTGETPELEDFFDPDHSQILRMADTNSVLAGDFDRTAFHAALVERLTALGWEDLEGPEVVTPSAAKPTGSPRR